MTTDRRKRTWGGNYRWRWPVLLCVVACLLGCDNQSAKSYEFITEDFQKAIQNIRPKAYFGSEIPYKPSYYKADEERKKIIGPGTATRHYEGITEQLCAPIKESFTRMIGNGIKGKDAYAFDDELNEFMREAGAYVLPLRVEDGGIEATYYNPKWEFGEPDSYGNFEGGNGKFLDLYKEYARRNGGGGVQIEPKDKGLVYLRESAYSESGSDIEFAIFYDFAVKQRNFEPKEFDITFDMVHGYLFILPKERADINQETIFFYIDLPFRVYGDEYAKIAALSRSDKTPDVKCYGHSNNEARYQWAGQAVYGDDFRAGKEFVSGLDEYLEPLILPFDKNYFYQKKDFVVDESNIVEPSLKCWLSAFVFIHADYNECLNTGYAEEFMDMLNRNVCIGFDKVEAASRKSYPYHQSHIVRPLYPGSARPYSQTCKNQILLQGDDK